MIIALLAILGIDLIVIAVLLASVLTRRRWMHRQPDAFKGLYESPAAASADSGTLAP